MHQRAKQVTRALSSSQPLIKAVPRKRMFLLKKQQGRKFTTRIPAREDFGIHISNIQRTVQCKMQWSLRCQTLRPQQMNTSTKAQHGLCSGPGQGAHGSSAQGTSAQGTTTLPASQGTSWAWLCPQGRERPALARPCGQDPPQHCPEQPGHGSPDRAARPYLPLTETLFGGHQA